MFAADVMDDDGKLFYTLVGITLNTLAKYEVSLKF